MEAAGRRGGPGRAQAGAPRHTPSARAARLGPRAAPRCAWMATPPPLQPSNPISRLSPLTLLPWQARPDVAAIVRAKKADMVRLDARAQTLRKLIAEKERAGQS